MLTSGSDVRKRNLEPSSSCVLPVSYNGDERRGAETKRIKATNLMGLSNTCLIFSGAKEDRKIRTCSVKQKRKKRITWAPTVLTLTLRMPWQQPHLPRQPNIYSPRLDIWGSDYHSSSSLTYANTFVICRSALAIFTPEDVLSISECLFVSLSVCEWESRSKRGKGETEEENLEEKHGDNEVELSWQREALVLNEDQVRAKYFYRI